MLRLDQSGPLYLQLYRALRGAILSGELTPGSRLPATRALAEELALSRNVVLLAFDQLRAEGYADAKVGAGTFVASPLPDHWLSTPSSEAATLPVETLAEPQLSHYARRALALTAGLSPARAASRPRFDFRYGAVAFDRSGMSAWKRLLNRHAERLQLDYSAAEGYLPLRQAIADYVRRSRGIVCQPQQVMVVNGTQQALDLVARVLLDSKARVLIEEPHYAGAREVFLAAGATLQPCLVDAEGLDIAKVGIGKGRARLVYVTPSHQFPTGAVMPLARRLALLEWAQQVDAYVVEDDYDSEYRYEGRPIEAVQALDRSGRTIYIGTFSKILFPALRLGYLIIPQPLIAPFSAAKYLADRHSAMLNQAVLTDFIVEGHFERHLRRMRADNEIRRAALLDALAEYLGDRVSATGTNAGVHLAVWLRDHAPADVDKVLERAYKLEVGVYSLNPLFYGTPPKAGLLLGYAALSPEQIREGIKRLAQVI